MPGRWQPGKPFVESAKRKHTFESVIKLLSGDERLLFRFQCLALVQRQRLLYLLNAERAVKKLMDGSEPDIEVREVGRSILSLLKGSTDA